MWAIVLGILSWICIRTIYRLSFHPLSKFPGPKLAAATHLYEVYFAIFKGGKFIWEIERMHKQYGPIVRINPRELHIMDPSYYGVIYAPSSRPRDKDPNFIRGFGAPSSVVATVSHDHHRFRRNILSSYFSKRSVTALEPLVQEKISKLSTRLETLQGSGKILDLVNVFAALTSDVITHYAYGESFECLEDEEFRSGLRDAANAIALLFHFNRFIPYLANVARLIPLSVLRGLRLQTAFELAEMKRVIYQHSVAALQNPEKKEKSMFDALTDPTLPPAERTQGRLEDEAIIVLGAGTETTARTLTIIAYHVYSNLSILQRLREELQQVMPTTTSTPTWNQLEHLPYLTAVIQEGLRHNIGSTTRLPRVAPKEALQYGKYVIPPGTVISQLNYFVNMDPTIFPDPEAFNPDRWIEASATDERLGRYMTSFTKGSRQCLGINLAYCELYLTVACLVRRFDIEICNTPLEKITVARDFGIGFPEEGPFIAYGKVTGIIRE